MYFDSTAVCESIGIISIRQKDMPHTPIINEHWVRIARPVVKITDERKSLPHRVPIRGTRHRFPLRVHHD